jgi:protein-S-isoprenylcysteine O-methyltransferase Ste14
MKAFLKHTTSLILPITVIILVPLYIEDNFDLSLNVFSIIGLLLGLAGLSILSITIRIGKGALAPWSPPKKLVTSGVYAYVRNSMITGMQAYVDNPQKPSGSQWMN